MAWFDEVLEFWFSELTETDWWTRNTETDAKIRARFRPLHEQLAAGDGAGVVAEARPMLAAVIALDQFPRNMFRGSARAYATDPLARRLARQAIEQQFDLGMQAAERLFLYLPFEHSEDLADQAYAVAQVSMLGRNDWTKYALAHQAVIQRFGRFPHRNTVLGRQSTPDEIEALKDPMNSF
jgi:uncharacterized protein (DUF924 family)